jgi:hypothetical protein
LTGFFSTPGLLFAKPLFCNSFFIGYSVIRCLFSVPNLSGKVTRLLICRSFGFWFDFEGHAGLFENVMGAVFFVSNMINCFPEQNRSRTVQPIGIKFLLPERSGMVYPERSRKVYPERSRKVEFLLPERSRRAQKLEKPVRKIRASASLSDRIFSFQSEVLSAAEVLALSEVEVRKN